MLPRLIRVILPTVLVALSLAPSACTEPTEVVVLKDLVYDPTIGYDGTFDLYLPGSDVDDGGLRPAVIAIHGGGWQAGDKSWCKLIGQKLASEGYVVASVNYRLAPKPPWPAQIDDVRTALRFLRSEEAAWMRIDPDRIAAFGGSAGGHLASMLLLSDRDERVEVAISANGEGDLVNLRDQDNILGDLLGTDRWTEDQLAAISPVTFARPDASLLLIHGTGDTNVIYEHSVALANAMVAAGGDVDFVTVHSDCHTECWIGEGQTISWFLDTRLGRHGPPRSVGSEPSLPPTPAPEPGEPILAAGHR